jgi:hypothetical protein
VLRTRDGGKTWQAGTPTKPAGVYFSSVIFHRDLIVAAGIKGIWTNSGEWKNESLENVNAVGTVSGEIWAVGPKGMVLKRTKP